MGDECEGVRRQVEHNDRSLGEARVLRAHEKVRSLQVSVCVCVLAKVCPWKEPENVPENSQFSPGQRENKNNRRGHLMHALFCVVLHR